MILVGIKGVAEYGAYARTDIRKRLGYLEKELVTHPLEDVRRIGESLLSAFIDQERIEYSLIIPKLDVPLNKIVEMRAYTLSKEKPLIIICENNDENKLKAIDFMNSGIEIIKLNNQKNGLDLDELLGDASKARKTLYWKPICSFDNLVKEMVENDC